MGQGGQNSIRGPNSITKYGPIGTLSMGFLILYLTPDLDNIMHEYCYWTKCRSMLVISLPYKCSSHTRIPVHTYIYIYRNIYIIIRYYTESKIKEGGREGGLTNNNFLIISD